MEIKVIDIDEALARFNGNKEVYIKILKRFIEINSKIQENTENVISTEKFDDIFIFFHSLKGGFGNLSAKQLYEKTLVIENFVKNNDLNSLKNELSSFYFLFENFKTFVHEYENKNLQ